jgi:hypothetical protein
MRHYVAPSREENWAGDREFAYLTEVDVLGWKFRKMTTGNVVIETPRVTLDFAGESMGVILTPDHVALLAALVALREPGVGDPLPDGWENVGQFVKEEA